MSENYRVLQLTDMHLYPDDYDDGADTIKKLVEASRPDLVLFTGDNVFGKNGEDLRFYSDIAAYFSSRATAWAAILGNHDGEFNSTDRKGLAEHIASLPASVSEVNAVGKRYGNFFRDTPFDGVAIACMDSGNRASIFERARGGFRSPYAALTPEQIKWYLSRAADKKAVFVYIHIPLNEFENGYYLALANCEVIYGAVRENISSDGSLRRRGDVVCSPAVNTGFFEKASAIGNLKAVFAGHDHLNDFAVRYKGVTLVQGQRSYSAKNKAYGFVKRGFTDFSGGTVLDILPDGAFGIKQLFLKDI